MKTPKSPVFLHLVGALLCAAPIGASADAPTSPSSDAPVIESLVSPTHLFPVEGTTFMLPNGTELGTYRPLPAYDKPSGRVIGEIVLVNPHCVSQTPPADCEQGLAWELRLKSGRGIALPTAEYSYGTDALVARGKSIDAPNGMAWSPVTTSRGIFWVSTLKQEVHRFEELASFVEELDQWCTLPGKCAAPSPEMVRELERVRAGEVVLLSCNLGYNITGIVTREGERYYRLERPDLDAGSAPTSLPKVGFTPVRTKAGAHSGAFSPRGC